MSSKGSLVLARLKQTVGIGQHTEDNELQEAIERLNHALAEAQGLRIKLVKLKGAVTATNTARAAVMASVVSSSGVDTTQGAVVDRLNKVVSVYAHQDGDLAEALGTVYDQVVLGEANEWCSSLEALQAAVEAHEVDRVKYDHYEDKVKGLRDARRARIAKGKTESDRDAGKLKRNEDKLAEAKAAFYDSRTTLLANLNAAHAQCAARCQRVVLRLLQYDFKRSQEAQRGCDSLQHILEAMNASVKSGQLEEQAAASQANASSRPPRPRVNTAGSTGAVMVAEAASAVAGNSGGETPEAKQNDMSTRLGRRAPGGGGGNPFGDSDDEDTPASSEKPPVNSATSSRGTFHDASAPAAAAATPPGPSPPANPGRGGGSQQHTDEGMGGRFMSWVRRKSTIAGGSKPQRQALGDDEAEETLSRDASKPQVGKGRARAATASSVTTAAAASAAPPPPPRRASLDPSSVAATAAAASAATASAATPTPAAPPAAYDPFAASAPSSSPPPAVEPTPAPLAPPAAATTNTRRRARGSSRGSVGVLSPSPSPDFTAPQASPPVAAAGSWDAFASNPTTTTAPAASPSPPSAAAAGTAAADPWAAFGNVEHNASASSQGVFDPFAAGSAAPASTVAVPTTEPAGGAPSLSPAPVGLDPFDAFVVLPSGPAAAQPRPDVLPPATSASTPAVRADDGNPSGGAFNPFG